MGCLTAYQTASPGSMAAISRAARFWALKQLARRAGVSQGFFRSWIIEISQEFTTIYLQPGSAKQIRFKNLSDENISHLAGPKFQTVRALWMSDPDEPIKAAVPDLVVPFCERRENESRPLFFRAGVNRIECFRDLPASALFTLCRTEETQQPHLDVHLRFNASMSVARRDGFLDRPVVDEWGLAFGQAIEALVPGWRPAPRRLRAKVSHDVDEVGLRAGLLQVRRGDVSPLVRTGWMMLPFDVRHAIKRSLEHRDPFRGAAQLVRSLGRGKPSCLALVQKVAGAAVERGLDSAVYWKASRLSPFDSGYDPRHERILTVIRWLNDQGVENGIHPGYLTFLCPEELQEELQILQSVIGKQQLGGRQHYLRWCPDTWVDWEDCGLAYDSTVGYPDQVGFRAGTCIPYRPWLMSLDREAHLLEIPLLVMDASLLDSMRLQGDELLNVVGRLIAKCRLVGGVFTFLCHNTTLRNASFAQPYEKILDMLVSSERFDWQSSVNNDWA